MDSYMRRAALVRVIDGDTYEMRIDLGYRVEGRFIIRLRNYDAPELPSTAGVAARQFAESVLSHATAIAVRSYQDRQSFARWIADVYVLRSAAPTARFESLCDLMRAQSAAQTFT